MIPQIPYILLAEDHVIIRRGLKVLLDTQFGKYKLLECDSVKMLLQFLAEQPITHLILDLQLTDANSTDVIPEIKIKYPNLMLMVFSMSSPELSGPRIIQMGADSFLSKQSSEQEVIKALELFLNGQSYVSQEVQDLMNEMHSKKTRNQNPFLELSDRETMVLNYLLLGESVKEISIRLELKATTVATYKARIFDKLNVTNIPDLIHMAEIYRFKNS